MDRPLLEQFKAHECEDPSLWISKYELLCEFNGWTEVQATRAFISFLDNTAASWFILLEDDDKKDKSRLFERFRQRFCLLDFQQVGLWQDLADVKQEENESATDFLSRIEKLCCRSGTKTFLEKFIYRGLRPELRVPFMSCIGWKDSYTYEEAIHAAKVAEATVRLSGPVTDPKEKPPTPTKDVSSKCDMYWQKSEHSNYAHKTPFINVLNSRKSKPPLKRIKNKKFKVNKHSQGPKSNSRSCQSDKRSEHILELYSFENKDQMNCKINIRIGKIVLPSLLDTGACLSVMDKKAFDKLQDEKQYVVSKSPILGVRGVNGNFIRVLGKVTLPIEIGKLTLYQDFCLLDHVDNQVILGRDFMHDQNAEISFPKQTLTLQNGITEVSLNKSVNKGDPNHFVRVISNITLQPRQKTIFKVQIDNLSKNTYGLIEPNFSLAGKYNVIGARCLVHTENRETVFEVLNPTNSHITLKANTILGNFCQIQNNHILGELKDPDTRVICNILDKKQNGHADNHFKEIALELGIDLSKSDLNETQKSQLLTLLGQYRHAFAKDLSELGSTKIGKHIIDTGNANPIRQFPYRTSPKTKEELDVHLDQMESKGIIRKSMSPWSSPILLVAKPNGEKRVCIDYRKLNRISKVYTQNLPNLSDVLDTLGEKQAQTFSVCDMKQGFWQLELDEESKEKTAFMTHRGQYEFNRLPYGLANSPATFNMVMNEVIRDLNWKSALVYVDDILIYSKNFEEHLGHLAALFDRLVEANLKLKPSKCQFACKEVRYLGHVITKEGIAVDPEKTDAIQSYSAPKNVKEVRMFLGLCNYYRKFIHNYSKITTPLNELLHKDRKFQWTDDCQRAFDTLKTKLTSAPILVFPDFNKEFILHTDASGTAIGYVLGQHDNDKRLRVIAYGGRMLRKQEQKWDVKDRECLALVVAIKQFHVYLANTKFHVYTDHIALQYLHRIKESTGRLARWSMYLQSYNFEVHYQQGKENVIADFLSRMEYKEPARQRRLSIDMIEEPYTEKKRIAADTHIRSTNQQPVQSKVPAIKAITDAEIQYQDIDPLVLVLQTTQLTRERIIEAQNKDEHARQMIDYIVRNVLPQDRKQADVIVRESNHYVISDGVLFHHYYPRGKGHMSERVIKQLVVPKSLQDDVLRSYHDAIIAAHPGLDRTYNNIRMKYFWKRMYSDIETYVKTCIECQQGKTNPHAKKAPLQPIPVTGVFERLQMDILGNLPKSIEGYTQILLVVCPFSKWCEAFPMKTGTAVETARIFFNEIICRYGPCREILTDLGKNFCSNLIKEVCNIFKITKLNTSSYHPACNGATERKNRSLEDGLKMYCMKNQRTWPNYLQGIMMAYRNSIATESTLYSPYYLVFGREPRNPIDLAIIPETVKGLNRDAEAEFKVIVDNVKLARTVAKSNIVSAQQQYKTQHDKSAEEPKFEILDNVWLYSKRTPIGLSPKLQRKWTGPYYISAHVGEYSYRLRRCSDHKILKASVHANRLKKFHDPRNRPTNPPENEIDDEDIDPDDVENNGMPDILDRVNETIKKHEGKPKVKSTKSKPNNTEVNTPNNKFDRNHTQNTNSRNTQNDTYQVEKIVKCRKRRNKKEYFIKWQGYDSSENTWEPAHHLSPDLVKQFHAMHKPRNKRRQ